MKDVNKIILVGRLGAQPSLRVTKNGHSVSNFSMATSEGEDETQWHQVVVWGKQAENCAQYLDKGQLVFVEGRLRSRQYETEDQVKKTVYEIVSESVRFLSYSAEKKSA